MSRLMYISNLGKQIQYIEKAVATYPELIQGEVFFTMMIMIHPMI